MAAYWSTSKPFLYWLTRAAIIVALTMGTVAQAEEDDEVLARVLADIVADALDVPRYECEPLLSTDIVLSLEIGDDDGEQVYVMLHGKMLTAFFMRTGLDYRWLIDGENDYQIILGPDMVAGYYDFSGKGDAVSPDNNFYCKFVRGES